MADDSGKPDDWTPPKPGPKPPADPIKLIEEEAEGTPFGEAASALRELDRELLNLQQQVDELRDDE